MDVNKEDFDKSILSLKKFAEKCASNRNNLPALNRAVGAGAVDKMRLFMIELAKNEMQRIIMLIDALNQLETTLVSRCQDASEMTPDQLSYMIRTLQGSYDRSMNLIRMVTENQNIYNIIFDNRVQAQIQNNGNINILNVKDADSRERIRTVFSILAENISKVQNQQQEN